MPSKPKQKAEDKKKYTMPTKPDAKGELKKDMDKKKYAIPMPMPKKGIPVTKAPPVQKGKPNLKSGSLKKKMGGK
jgi:hypothetical protein